MSIPGPNDPESAYPPEQGTGVLVGNGCWFAGDSPPFPASDTVVLEWAEFDDGIPPFTDARVNPDDSTLIEIQTAGTYMLVVEALCQTADPTDVNLSLDLNNGQGPLNALSCHTPMPGDGAVATLKISCPIQFSLNDVIKATVTGGAVDVTVTDCKFVLLGLSTSAGDGEEILI